MVGGGLRCLRCFFANIVVLVLGICLYGVEASSEKHVIHKKVGDTVELSSSLPTQGVTMAIWKYGGLTVADKDGDVSKEHQFKGRLDFNTTNFMLTVRKLTLQDSGDFSFISEVNDIQRPTVIITLQVHEPITRQPDLKQINFTHFASDKSCIVLLECSASADSAVTYIWTVGNQTRTGPKLEYNFKERDGDTTFTCTVSNYVSENSSTSRTIKCSNDTVFPEDKEMNFVLILGVAGGCCLMIVIIVGVAVYFCHCQETHTGSDINDLTVYADINDVAIEDGTMKPCSVYETIDNRTNTAPPGPQTVYDKIQFSRVRKASVSPYQDIV